MDRKSNRSYIQNLLYEDLCFKHNSYLENAKQQMA